MKLIRSDRAVLSRPDPGIDNVAMPALLELLHQAGEPSEETTLRLTRLWLTSTRWGWRGRSTAPEEASETSGCLCRKQRRRGNHQRLGKTPPGTAEPRTSSRIPI